MLRAGDGGSEVVVDGADFDDRGIVAVDLDDGGSAGVVDAVFVLLDADELSLD